MDFLASSFAGRVFVLAVPEVAQCLCDVVFLRFRTCVSCS